MGLIADWAVSNFEETSAHIDSWLGANLVTAPLEVRRLGEEQLMGLRCFGNGQRLCRLLGEVEGMLTELSLAFLPARELSW